MISDIAQFLAVVLEESALAHCEECGEIIDSFDRCGCDYIISLHQDF